MEDSSMSPTNAREISNQAHIMATTARPTSHPQVMAFDRFLAQVGMPTQASDGTQVKPTQCHPNGHITPEAAVSCGQAMAEAELATIPTTVDMDAALVAVAITITTVDRFQCSNGCKFGHRTQGQAVTCSTGSQAKATRQVKASIPVVMAPKPTSTPEPAQPASTPEPAKAARKSLKASQGGNTGKA
jgi:hypothetical protein